MTRLVLPWPPSMNNLTAVVRGRKILSSRGRTYRANALAAIQEQGSPKLGEARLRVELLLNPPTAARRDVANFEKACVDALVFANVMSDDSQIDDLRIVRGEVLRPDGQVIVLLEPYARPEMVGSP